MEIRTVSWKIVIKDEASNEIDLGEIPTNTRSEIGNKVADGYWEGDEEYEDYTDEMVEFKKGDEIRDFRKDQP